MSLGTGFEALHLSPLPTLLICVFMKMWSPSFLQPRHAFPVKTDVIFLEP